MQTLDLDEDIYFLLILGMVAVGAHAYTLYNQRIDDNYNVSQRWRFLANIPIQLVTSKSSFGFGFLIYLMLFEMLYLVLASSSSLVLMTYQMAGREELTGAMSDSVKPSGAVPILASTAIILLSQVPPFRVFELAIRSMTHRFAKIPDSLKSVRQNIVRRLQTHPLSFPGHVPENYSEDVSSGKIGQLYERAEWLKKDIDSWIADAFTAEDAEAFSRSYWNVLCLNEYTLDTVGTLLWDASESEEIITLFRSTEHEVAQLRSTVETAASKYSQEQRVSGMGGNVPSNDEIDKEDIAINQTGGSSNAIGVTHWKTQKNKCNQLEERLILLLSLLLINQPDVQKPEDPQLAKLISCAHDRVENDLANTTLNAMLYGGIFSIVLFTAYYFVEEELRTSIRQDPFTHKAPYGDYLEKRLQYEAENAQIYRWYSGMHLTEREEAKKNAESFFLRMSGHVGEAFEEALVILLIFGSSVLTALSVRQGNIRLKNWSLRVRDKKLVYPVSKYYMCCLYAMLCSLSVVFLYYFITLALMPSFAENKDLLALDIIEPFLTFMPSLLLMALVAGVCAFFSVYIFDLTFYSELIEDAEKASDGNQIDHHGDKLPTLTRLRKFLICVYFGFNCAIAAVAANLYINELSSSWDVAGVYFINFLGFSILFMFLFRSATVYMDVSGRHRNGIPDGIGRSGDTDDSGGDGQKDDGNKSAIDEQEIQSGVKKKIRDVFKGKPELSPF